MRLDYQKFQDRNTEVIALGPDGPNAFKRFWETEQMPFIGLADIRSQVASLYHQEVNWFKLGRMPAVLVIDKEGKIRFSEYGESMADIPENSTVLEAIDQINQN
ncbi:MAG: peroxiredoxin family protein [Anaerolineaceae bacterium]|nr:peroxiredoxin family protein [Anaerolineaceae bacterium]